MGPTRCTPVALGFKGSEWSSKLGPVANNGENIASGRESLGMRLGIFHLAGGNRPPEYVDNGRLSMAY